MASEKKLKTCAFQVFIFHCNLHSVNFCLILFVTTCLYIDCLHFNAIKKLGVKLQHDNRQQMLKHYRKGDIEDLEKVQNTATRLLPELEGFKYCDRLKACKLHTLHYRRLRGDMIETFKIVSGKYDTALNQTNLRRDFDRSRFGLVRNRDDFDASGSVNRKRVYGSVCDQSEPSS